MPSAKDIQIRPIPAAAANTLVKRVHYSGKVVQNSQVHFGVFLNGRLEGAMQFGPSMVKRLLRGLVADTGWNDFIELNRMAFSDRLPRNSESRALGVALRAMRRQYPHLQWVISFSDATQCGDGTIYRAAGFVLTGITENKTLLEFPDGSRVAKLTLTANWNCPSAVELSKRLGADRPPTTASGWKALGGRELPGYQLRYVYFLNPEARARLTVPVIPFSEIDRIGAGMFRGERVSMAERAKDQAAGNHPALGGETPTRTLHPSAAMAANDPDFHQLKTA